MKEEFINAYTSYLFNELGDRYIDEDLGIDGFKKKCIESGESIYNFLNENYFHVHLNSMKSCASLGEFVSTHFGNIDNLIKYLLTPQSGYAVSTIEAWDILPKILGYNFAIETGYRHAYITVFDPPIDDKNMIIEWAGGKTEENLQKRVHAHFQTETPGIVILGLIAADKRLKATQNYTYDKYIPWENDCHTYALHIQEKMNELLPREFRQKIITLATHVAPDAPLEENASMGKSIENYSKKIRADRNLNTHADTQSSHMFKSLKSRFTSGHSEEKKDEISQEISSSSSPLLKKNG